MCCPLAIAALTVATWGESTRAAATRGMRRDVLRRIRWANVALAVAVVTALVTVVAWPLVSNPAVDLPPDMPRPLVEAKPPPERESGPRAGAANRGPAERAKRGDAEEGGAKRGGTKGGAKRGGTRGGAKRRGA